MSSPDPLNPVDGPERPHRDFFRPPWEVRSRPCYTRGSLRFRDGVVLELKTPDFWKTPTDISPRLFYFSQKRFPLRSHVFPGCKTAIPVSVDQSETVSVLSFRFEDFRQGPVIQSTRVPWKRVAKQAPYPPCKNSLSTFALLIMH